MGEIAPSRFSLAHCPIAQRQTAQNSNSFRRQPNNDPRTTNQKIITQGMENCRKNKNKIAKLTWMGMLKIRFYVQCIFHLLCNFLLWSSFGLIFPAERSCWHHSIPSLTSIHPRQKLAPSKAKSSLFCLLSFFLSVGIISRACNFFLFSLLGRPKLVSVLHQLSYLPQSKYTLLPYQIIPAPCLA